MFQNIITGIFLLWIFRNILFWVYLWQLKEYRLDRLFVHLFETIQGRNLLISPLNIIKWAGIFAFVLVAVSDKLTLPYSVFIAGIIIFQSALVLKEVFYHTLRRPVWTKKAIIVVLFSLVFCLIIILFPLANIYLWYLLVDKVTVLIISLFVFFLAFPTEILRDMKVRKAIKKMREYKNILVIGVSGSYGKTSTKEYIAQLLSKKFQVVKTPFSNNTTIGVVNTILSKIKDSTEIFVVEMGAYKKGEIAELATIVRPTISVTTAISDQHISLYGSMENIVQSEYELINVLPKKNGLALFNGNNENTHLLYDLTKIEKIIYKYYQKKPGKLPEVGAYDMKVTTHGISFTAVVNGKEFVCKTSLFGAHVIENILPAIFLAGKLGLSVPEIQSGVAHFYPPPQTMEKISLAQNIQGIDDTFNASPESVFSALDYLDLYKKKRILVLGPLTELGINAKKRHFEIGKKASTSCDFLFCLNKNFFKEISNGIKTGKGKCVFEAGSADFVAQKIEAIITLGDVVLFEGKESKMVMKKLL